MPDETDISFGACRRSICEIAANETVPLFKITSRKQITINAVSLREQFTNTVINAG